MYNQKTKMRSMRNWYHFNMAVSSCNRGPKDLESKRITEVLIKEKNG